MYGRIFRSIIPPLVYLLLVGRSQQLDGLQVHDALSLLPVFGPPLPEESVHAKADEPDGEQYNGYAKRKIALYTIYNTRDGSYRPMIMDQEAHGGISELSVGLNVLAVDVLNGMVGCGGGGGGGGVLESLSKNFVSEQEMGRFDN